jgi:flagellar assembly protein FliH
LSRIIRGIQPEQIQAKKFEVQLQNQFIFQNDSVTVQEHVQHVPTMEEITEERNKLLQQAREQIELEKAAFEQFQQEQMQAIEQLKQMWEEEKPLLEQQAYDQAFSEGFEEGIQKASASMEETLKLVNQTMDLASVNADKYIEEQEQVVLDLALKIADKIIGYEVDRNDEAFLSVIQRAIKEVRELHNIKVYVSVEYYPLISKHRDELAEMFPPDVQFLIFVNEELQATESYIETSHGRVIVSIDEQLAQLRIKLNEILDSKE